MGDGAGTGLDPGRAEHLARDFLRGFPAYCGFRVDGVGQGWFRTSVRPAAEHLQQDGFVHAGVLATLADHTAGYAGYTLIPPDRRILTVEFKINFLAPAVGREIRCHARVLKPGRTVLVAESEVFSAGDAGRLVAKATVTLMSVAVDRLQGDAPVRATPR